ncbi:hypothetical protein MNEG_3637 [Monoraphidium neglectum]|jgi:serine/threonine protein kinase|uniref:Protein kinase domain-containing protein n=1 Tax=Monoraphidium neglectum TaxID=145388 RepID=A0A0D2MNP0_9CHLO|nr:hypothetical protein MNEG_3637 [Monoraphidium neglectum]KIZ04320.1 hypothetical protein MNEG_3637 [Monoraphidium neglectum]|eukprot:XP_013903339.1 hypothetical protein MNEG_3637 [Monoraphidium neglectum]
MALLPAPQQAAKPAAVLVTCCAQGQRAPEDRLSPAELLPVAAETCVAVAALHDAATVHKDLKPANFLVAADGHLCVGDLGVSDDASHHALSGAGTWFFQAPEQRYSTTRLGRMLHALRIALADMAERLGFPCDSRPVDVWALAVTWLTISLTVDEVLRVMKTAHAGKPLQLPAYVPAALADLLQRGMLVKRPSKRFTIRQVMAHPYFARVSWRQAEARRLLLLDLRALAAQGREYIHAGSSTDVMREAA